MARDQRSDRTEPVRITTAASSRDEDIAGRQRRYLMAMSLRSACFIGAIVAALADVDWLWPFLIAGAVVLPYVAVVLANATVMRREAFSLEEVTHDRPELGPTTTTQLPG